MTRFNSRSPRAGTAAPISRKIANKVVCQLSCASLGLALFGCIDRPVVSSEPNTTNLFVNQIEVRSIEAIDLLFVVDNSISMADKQQLLREAVPLMVSRLITPDCVDDAGNRQPSDGQGCASFGADFSPEFQPVNNIHLGVITSSLGGFGSEQCKDEERYPGVTDKSRLIPKVRETVASTGEAVPNPTDLGFLAWTGASSEAETAAALATLQQDLSLHVAAAGETGCGFEAPLEAWYRFLVDPAPPLDVTVVSDEHGTRSGSTGPDRAILDQRTQFLRPGSLVGIIVLTDENDCSVMEGGSVYPFAGDAWRLPTTGKHFTVASAACETNPNDRCCHSCALSAPDGCTDTCQRPDSPEMPEEDDRSGVRCFEGKRRFGVDLLYPTDRYVAGLTQSLIVNSHTGESTPNPLLADRRPDLVFLAGIVGVPWQDVATDASLSDPSTLVYRTAEELAEVDADLGASRWELLLGRPGLPSDSPACRPGNGAAPPEECGQAPAPPLDPFLVESIAPRSGVHPLTSDPIVSAGTDAWSPINGHEYDNAVDVSDYDPTNNDLQYSCIFPLAASAVKADCTVSDTSCDCGTEPGRNRSLCKPSQSASVTADTTQRYGKAYPPSRILRVLKDFGENSIVASICPKIMDTTSPSFGYNPAVNAIVDQLASKLGGQCLPRTLTLSDGNVPCMMIEVTHEARVCDANERRAELTAAERSAVDRRMSDSDQCKLDATDERPLPLCSTFGACEILETADEAKADCFGNTAADQQPPGFCYIDPRKGPTAGGLPSGAGSCLEGDESTWDTCTNPHITSCDPTERRMLRFVGQRTPLPNSTTFVACAGDAASESTELPPLPGAGD